MLKQLTQRMKIFNNNANNSMNNFSAQNGLDDMNMSNILDAEINMASESSQEEYDNTTEVYTDKDGKPIYADDLISLVNNYFQEFKTLRLGYELQWQLNMNFLEGNQYCDINTLNQSITQQDKIYDWQEMESYNKIAAIHATRMAKLNRKKPAQIVRPATHESNDIATAKICTSIVRGTSRRLLMSEKTKLATAWSEITGTVFYKQIWDSTKGELIGNYENETITEGDIDEIICSPFEIYPDSPFSADLDNCKRLIHAKAYDVDDIDLIWNVQVEGHEVDVFTMDYTNIGTGGLGYKTNIYKYVTTKKQNCEIVKELYEKPNKEFPNGRLIIIAGDKLLSYSELPYKNAENQKREFPFTRQQCEHVPSRFWGVSIIERLIPIQRSYNAIRNRIHENINRAAIGILLVTDDGVIDLESLEEEGLFPGQILTYSPASPKPAYLISNGLPAEVTTELNSLMAEFRSISGVSELVGESSVPTGANSGVALEILEEQDDTRLSLPADNIKNAHKQISKHWLRLYKQFSQGPRLLRFEGENNDVNVLYFQASDITSDDIIYDTENELAQSLAQKRQMVKDLFSMGLFTDSDTGKIDKTTRAKIFEMLEMGNWESANDLDTIHINRALRENLMLDKGEAPQINKYDNDELHIKQHIAHILSEQFIEQSKTEPQLYQILDQHIQLHQQQKSLKQQGSAQTQIAKQQQVQQMKQALAK